MVSFGWDRTLIAHESNSWLSFGSVEMPMSILAGAEGTIVFANEYVKQFELFVYLLWLLLTMEAHQLNLRIYIYMQIYAQK